MKTSNDYVRLNGSLWRTAPDEIIVGCCNFLLMGQQCASNIAFDRELQQEFGDYHALLKTSEGSLKFCNEGKFYTFVCLEAFLPDMSNDFCSVLRYKRKSLSESALKERNGLEILN